MAKKPDAARDYLGDKFIVKVCGRYLGIFTSLKEAATVRESGKLNSPLHPNHGINL